MDVLANLAMGFAVATQPQNLLFCLIGVVFGTIVGILPGLGPTAGIAILIPLTFGMDAVSAIIMLCGIYYGAMYGGTATSVLINVPGESATVMTCLDGHQMARQGRAGVALGIAAFGSFFAGTVGVVALMFLAPWLAEFAVSFGPPEYAALMIMGLSTLSSLGSKSTLKALLMGLVGLILGTVGFDIVTGRPRFTFGTVELTDGIDFIPVAIGLFGIGEVLRAVEKGFKKHQVIDVKLSSVFPSAKDWLQARGAILRGTVVGFLVGALPGAGATISSFLAYALEKRVSKHPERFGTGTIEGVAAPESANNAATAGTLTHLLVLGLPGGGATAVMLGALIMYGVRPGPLLFEKRPDLVWGLIASMYLGNLLLVVMNIAFIPAFVQFLRTPPAMLMPIIVVFCLVGAYSINFSLFDVGLMLLFGVVGYYADKYEFPPAPLVLALVLGPMLERALRQSLIMSQGSMEIFFARPVSAVLMALAIASLALPVAAWCWRQLRANRGRLNHRQQVRML